jgi:hypothetical protein
VGQVPKYVRLGLFFIIYSGMGKLVIPASSLKGKDGPCRGRGPGARRGVAARRAPRSTPCAGRATGDSRREPAHGVLVVRARSGGVRDRARGEGGVVVLEDVMSRPW